jgi:hypothetical protein
MNKLNRFVIIFCLTSSLSTFAQNVNEGLKLDSQNNIGSNFLPPILLSFDAIFDNTKVELSWSSDTESNNNFYTIEKSRDAMNFEPLTMIKAFGNNSNIINYFDVDFTPYEGISYYRLTQIDPAGTILSSRLVSINNKAATDNFVINQSAVYDTPANLMGSENQEVIVVLRDEKGIESFSKVIVDQQNNITVSSDNDNKLLNGTYTVIASSNNRLFSQKVTVK